MAVAVAFGGVVHYEATNNIDRLTGQQALYKLDLLYLNEPAPGLEALGILKGQRAVVVFCETCKLPRLPGEQVVQSSSKGLAAQYGLLAQDGSVGPGYALINSKGNVRYRSFDTDPAQHRREIEVLIEGLL